MKSLDKTLILIPTYNERDNVEQLLQRINALGLNIDVLFIDDNSPDGTGAVIDKLVSNYKHIKVLHRVGKLGIGSAHQDGIEWAYHQGYKILISMDCDFTHPPEIIPELIKYKDDYDVVIGSRYILKDSLQGWNLYRKALTHLGYFLTRRLLRMPYDATGALRLYRLDVIPAHAFKMVVSKGYSFFYESLFLLNFNNYKIKEVPIKLPVRTYGHSKMKLLDAWQSLRYLMVIYMHLLIDPQRFVIIQPLIYTNQKDVENSQQWDKYWQKSNDVGGIIYSVLATIYRNCLIKPSLDYFIKKHFKKDDYLLHAGCGSGQVDQDIINYVKILAMDFSVNALMMYQRVNKGKSRVLFGSILEIPVIEQKFDGIYNLGVMEHFSEQDIKKILFQFKKVLKPKGKVMLFWPPESGISVIFLKGVHFLFNNIFGLKIKFHPDEISRIKSKKHLESILSGSGFKLIEFYFGPKDFFTQCVVVLALDEGI